MYDEIMIMQRGPANKKENGGNTLILYFETFDSESSLSLAHSVYVTADDEFSLSVKKKGKSDHCLTLTVSGAEYHIENTSDWLDSAHMSFYWQRRVVSAFNRIVRRFAELAARAVTRASFRCYQY